MIKPKKLSKPNTCKLLSAINQYQVGLCLASQVFQIRYRVLHGQMKSQTQERETLKARGMSRENQDIPHSIVRGQRHKHREIKILRKDKLFLCRVRKDEENSKNK